MSILLPHQLTSTMVLKLYGTNDSPNTLRVALILKEKEVPYEFVSVDLAHQEHKTPQYLAEKHPFGQVPYMFVRTVASHSISSCISNLVLLAI